jgi:hypothetical protein
VYAAAAEKCGDMRSISAEAALSGKIGARRARGRLILGSAADGRLRLEGVAPFGAPVFVLAADGASTTLLLPREDRVLAGVPVADVLDALAGLRLEALDVHAMLTGCGVDEGQVTGGRRYGGALLAVEFGRNTAWIREQPTPPRILAAEVDRVTVEYPEAETAPPSRIRLRAKPERAGAPGVDVVLRMSQVETNVTLPDEAFTVRVPPNARPITLAELREAGLLGGS